MGGIPREFKILGGIAVAAIVIGVLLFKFGGEVKQAAPLTDRPGTYSKGNPQAPVTVTEFSDFQCPACRSAQALVDQVMVEYPSEVRFSYRHMPLSSHPHARITAQAAEAAGAQGKFWEMHDLLFDKQDDWGNSTKVLSSSEVKEKLKSYATELGLDQGRFISELDNETYIGIVSADVADGEVSGVNATPSFFVNGILVQDLSYEALKQAIDAALGR